MKKVPGSFWLLVASVIGAWHLPAAGKAFTCNVFLSAEEQNKTLTSTQWLITYFHQLFNNGVVDQSGLSNLAESIKLQHKLINIVPHYSTKDGVIFASSVHEIHYKNLEQLIQQSNPNYQEILDWITLFLKEQQQVRNEKQKSENKTISPYVKMEFHRVQKGKFLMGEAKVPTELTHDFEVMTTQVTQWMWASEMKTNPSGFRQGPNSIGLSIDSKFIEMQPDNPVENITWYSAAMFANHMSKKHNLSEVYDFSEVNFKPGTSMKAGTLDIVGGEVKILGENIYETEGYRLPTEAEKEYLLSDRGRSKTEYFTGMTKENFTEYAWCKINSNDQTHPVREKLAFQIDGQNFYDLLGNVAEWGSDWYNEGGPLGGRDPVGSFNGKPKPSRVLRGFSWDYKDIYFLRFTCRCAWTPDKRGDSTGFRLVRTVR